MRFALGLAFASVFAAAASAQDWATREVCTVDKPRVHEEVFAPASLDELEQLASSIPNSTGKFWQITSPTGATSHLWGTFHSADPLILALPETVRDAIANSRTVAVEIDFTHPDRQSYRDAQMMEGRFSEASDPFEFSPGDGTVAGLSPEVSGWVRDRAVELGWTEDFDLIMSLAGMAEMLLSDPCEDFTQGILPIQDDFIQLLGRLAGAEILSLETPDEMIGDLSESDETARAIIQTYAAYLRPAESNTERATSFALYLEGRLGLMEVWDRAYQQEIYGSDGLDSLELTDSYLLEHRNNRFADRLSGPLADGGVFIAIGSAHLPGEIGLVALLAEAGYTLTRVSLPGEAP
ncbi:TraB/GumN family protein [Silicimonas sp. MF1-12-2]|uniref:TraB/GumN family protein n=1 Tax=Silicimonas sp. MF1-12-2 TaxID=3384793 RepID=UPI0039B481AB